MPLDAGNVIGSVEGMAALLKGEKNGDAMTWFSGWTVLP